VPEVVDESVFDYPNYNFLPHNSSVGSSAD
jgi:hypothetical protein